MGMAAAISESCRSLATEMLDDSDDDFIAEHTKTIAATDFDGSFHNLKVVTRKTFAAESPSDSYSPLTTRNVRTALGLTRVCEMVSMALIDVDGSSYGKSDYGDGRHSYSVEDVQFEPKGCSWTANVRYSSMQLVKSSSRTMGRVEREFEGVMPIKVVCTAVVISDGGKYTSTENGRQEKSAMDDEFGTACSRHSNHSDDSAFDDLCSKHYSLDITMEVKEGLKDIDKFLIKAMSITLSCIEHDISRQLSKHNLPTFPDGCKDLTFRSVYQLNAKIKSGAFATVCLGTHRESGKRVAIKCVHRQKLSPQDDCAILREVNILSSIKHERVCSIVDFFVEDECYFIIMPLMEGGDLFDRIGKIKNYSEECARNLVFEMLRAIAHLHEKNIAHCDLKPKNLLLQYKDDDSSVILADFGFAMRVYAPKTLTKQCGTPYFVAPEILLRKGYDTQADMWSVGVIVYSLLSGSLPFTGKRHLDLFKSIIAGEYTFDEDRWECVSDGAKDLVRKLLVVNPAERFSAQDALNHDWIRADSKMLRRNALGRSSMRMRTFNARLSFKSAILLTQSVIRWRNVTRDSISKRQSASAFNSMLDGLAEERGDESENSEENLVIDGNGCEEDVKEERGGEDANAQGNGTPES